MSIFLSESVNSIHRGTFTEFIYISVTVSKDFDGIDIERKSELIQNLIAI